MAKDYVVRLRLNKEEYDHWKEYCDLRDITLTQCVRDSVESAMMGRSGVKWGTGVYLDRVMRARRDRGRIKEVA